MNRLGEDMKIIIMLRNPVDRAFSAYTHVARSVKENLTFEEALQAEEGRLDKDAYLTPMVMYKDMGLYYSMVKAYLENFKDVHVIMYEDFQKDTQKVVDETYFWGILLPPHAPIFYSWCQWGAERSFTQAQTKSDITH